MSNFEIIILKDAQNFLNSLELDVRRKIYKNIIMAQNTNDSKLFKKLQGSDIWEFRTKFQSMEYRMLSFWDKNTRRLVVVSNGFIKKTQKTPAKEIQKAEQIRKRYFNK